MENVSSEKPDTIMENNIQCKSVTSIESILVEQSLIYDIYIYIAFFIYKLYKVIIKIHKVSPPLQNNLKKKH